MEHLSRALRLRFNSDVVFLAVSAFNARATRLSASMPLEELQCYRQSAIDHWKERAAQLRYHPTESSQTSEMDWELDLVNCEDGHLRKPLRAICLVREGAGVTGLCELPRPGAEDG